MNAQVVLVCFQRHTTFHNQGNGVVITNDTGVHPRIRATKQQIYNTTHGVHIVPAGSLDFPYEPEFSFDVINTEAGGVMRQSSMAELYQLIYCCLMAKDQQQIALLEAAEIIRNLNIPVVDRCLRQWSRITGWGSTRNAIVIKNNLS